MAARFVSIFLFEESFLSTKKSASKTAVIGECKFRSMSIGKEEYETLHDRGRLIAPWRVTHYFLFSLGGFTAWVREKADEDSGTRLVPIEKLYEPRG